MSRIAELYWPRRTWLTTMVDRLEKVRNDNEAIGAPNDPDSMDRVVRYKAALAKLDEQVTTGVLVSALYYAADGTFELTEELKYCLKSVNAKEPLYEILLDGENFFEEEAPTGFTRASDLEGHLGDLADILSNV